MGASPFDHPFDAASIHLKETRQKHIYRQCAASHFVKSCSAKKYFTISQFAKSHLAKSQFTKSHLEIGKKLADNLQSPLPIGLAESHAMFSI